MSELQNHDYLDSEARRAVQGESIARRRLFEAERKRDRMICDKNFLIGRLCVESRVNLNHKRQSYTMQTNGVVRGIDVEK